MLKKEKLQSNDPASLGVRGGGGEGRERGERGGLLGVHPSGFQRFC